MTVPTKEQVEAANNFHSYRKGWTDGASGKVMDANFNASPYVKIYLKGYNEGYLVRKKALGKAESKYGHIPSIMRAAEELVTE